MTNPTIVKSLNEIRFHGMGGQGAVMGALMLSEAAFSEGNMLRRSQSTEV